MPPQIAARWALLIVRRGRDDAMTHSSDSSSRGCPEGATGKVAMEGGVAVATYDVFVEGAAEPQCGEHVEHTTSTTANTATPWQQCGRSCRTKSLS